MAEQRREPTPEEIAEQIKQIDVADLFVSTVTTLGQLAYVKLGAKESEQARLAIDGIAALLPPLEGHADEQLLRDLRQLLANAQLAFVTAGGAPAAKAEAPEGVAEPAAEAKPEAPAAAEEPAAPEEPADQQPVEEADAPG